MATKMPDTNLEPGWLRRDVQRAADQIKQWERPTMRERIALIIATCQGNPETKDSWLPAADAILKEWPR